MKLIHNKNILILILIILAIIYITLQKKENVSSANIPCILNTNNVIELPSDIEIYNWTTTLVNCRASPDIDSTILITLDKFEKVIILKKYNHWTKVKHKDVIGYIYSEYLTNDKDSISTNRWNIELTKDEIDLLAKILWIEARGESYDGKCAVVEIVFNRMVHKEEFEGSLYDVLSKYNQFASWKLRYNAYPTEDEYDAINDVLEGNTNILSFDYVYFSTFPRNSNYIKIKNHYFCKY